MKLDLFIIIAAILMIFAMILTVLYGKKFSRHGYGTTTTTIYQSVAEIDVGPLRPSPSPTQGPPLRTG